ncbi:MAG: tetratricopeptide repeat protein [Bacteroidetes bacterium]|nr:tetratricopeptide repeat protein [Bacteroidota bacterium]
MFRHFRIPLAIFLLLIIVLSKSLNGQADEQNSKEENYLDNIGNYYEMILKTDSTNYDALTNLGVIYQQSGNMEKSLYYFEKAVKFNPKKSRAYHNLGILNSIIGRLDEARINLNKAAELNTTSSNSIRQLGIIHLQNNMPDEAIKLFERALIRDNLDTESLLGKTLAYWLLKKYENVLTQVNEIKALGLKFKRMELLLADVYFKIGDYEKALKYAKLDESENSSQPEGHYLLGNIYRINGEIDKAESEFDEAFTIARKSPNPTLTLSLNIYFQFNNNQTIRTNK